MRPELPRATRDAILAVVEEVAAEQLPSARAVRPACSRVRPRPWQGSLRTARDAYLEYVDARVSRIASTATDARRRWSPGTDLETLRARAREALRSAAPEGTTFPDTL